MTPSAYTVLKITLSITIALVIIHIGLHALGIFTDYGDIANAMKDRFDVDHEASVPTWYSQTLLFIAAGLAWIAGSGINHKIYWRALAILLLAMSIDEGASFHETAGVWVGQNLNAYIDLGFIMLRDWVVVGLLLVIAVTLIFWRFIWQLPPYTRYTLIAGGMVFFSGALLWESLHFTTFQFDHGDTTFLVHVSTAIEEGLEMTGACIIVYALLDYVQRFRKQATPILAKKD